jgi:type IV pilus assembly protein PilC
MTPSSTKTQRIYIWSGHDAQSQPVAGEIAAPHDSMARAMLRHQGIRLTSLDVRPEERKGRISTQELALFTRQLATMMRAGVPLLQSLELVERSTPNPILMGLVKRLRLDIETGTALNTAFRKYPAHFSPLYCSLVAAGEVAGILDDMMDKLAQTLEKNEALQSKVRAALMYPAAVVTVAIAVVLVILLAVVPVFQDVFASFGATLPLPTQWVIAVSQALKHSAWLVVPLSLMAAFAWRSGWLRHPAHQERMDRWKLRLPLIGPMIKSSVVARWTQTLSALLSAGIPLVEALGPVASACDHSVYARASETMREQVAQGSSLNETMASTGLFPNMVVQMCAIGEETGSIDNMLARAGAMLENEVHDQLAGLSSLLEPVIIVVLGTVVGGILVAMYLPIFKLGQVF